MTVNWAPHIRRILKLSQFLSFWSDLSPFYSPHRAENHLYLCFRCISVILMCTDFNLVTVHLHPCHSNLFWCCRRVSCSVPAEPQESGVCGSAVHHEEKDGAAERGAGAHGAAERRETSLLPVYKPILCFSLIIIWCFCLLFLSGSYFTHLSGFMYFLHDPITCC